MHILFLCTGNACRSQMAQALANQLFPQHHFYSAGIETHGLNPLALKVCNELGLDLSTHTSKHVNTLKSIHFDLIITVCDHAHEQCPNFPNSAKKIHHSFPDPPKLVKQQQIDGVKLTAEAELNIYREVRDLIKNWLQKDFSNLLHEINDKINLS